MAGDIKAIRQRKTVARAHSLVDDVETRGVTQSTLMRVLSRKMTEQPEFLESHRGSRNHMEHRASSSSHIADGPHRTSRVA